MIFWLSFINLECFFILSGVFGRGQGIFEFKDGNVYEGEFYNGKKNGKGIMTYKNNTKYDGYWYEDKNFSTDPFVFGHTIDHDITLYARYYNKVTLLNADKSIYQELTIFDGDVFNKPSVDPTKQYYTFDNWYLDDIIVLKRRTNVKEMQILYNAIDQEKDPIIPIIKIIPFKFVLF